MTTGPPPLTHTTNVSIIVCPHLSWQFIINSSFELAGMQSAELLACMALVMRIVMWTPNLSQVLKKALDMLECGKCERYAVQKCMTLFVSVLSYAPVTPKFKHGKLLHACNWLKQVPWRLHVKGQVIRIFCLPTQLEGGNSHGVEILQVGNFQRIYSLILREGCLELLHPHYLMAPLLIASSQKLVKWYTPWSVC